MGNSTRIGKKVAESGAVPGQARKRNGTPSVYPFHVFLFALASVLHPLTFNLNMAALSDAAAALAGANGFAAVVYLGVAALRRRFDTLTAVLSSIWVVGALFYLDLFRSLNQLLDGGFMMVRTYPSPS